MKVGDKVGFCHRTDRGDERITKATCRAMILVTKATNSKEGGKYEWRCPACGRTGTHEYFWATA